MANIDESMLQEANDGSSSMPSFLRAQNLKMDELTPVFPTGVIVEILARLPLRTLTQLQLVCKDWQTLINTHYFIEKHLDHSDFIHHWHNVVMTTPIRQTNSDQDSFSYEHGCDGLLLMMNHTKKKLFVWNPATHRVLELPNSHSGRLGFAFCFVAATKSYRLVSFYKDNETGGKGCEVFTPGQSKLWKRLVLPDVPSCSENKEGERVSVVASGGAVHCIVIGLQINIEIVSLDLESESFTVNRFPKLGRSHDWKNYWDLDWDGKLGIADIVGQNLEVMELDDYKKRRWSEKKRVVHLPFLKKGKDDSCGYEGDSVFPLFARKGEIWFWLKDKYTFVYNMGSGEHNIIQESPKLAVESKIYPYKASLIAFEGMVPDTVLERYRPNFDLS